MIHYKCLVLDNIKYGEILKAGNTSPLTDNLNESNIVNINEVSTMVCDNEDQNLSIKDKNLAIDLNNSEQCSSDTVYVWHCINDDSSDSECCSEADCLSDEIDSKVSRESLTSDDFSDVDEMSFVDSEINLDEITKENNTLREKYMNDDRIMFRESNLSVSDVLLMIEAIEIKFATTEKFHNAMINFTRTLAGP